MGDRIHKLREKFDELAIDALLISKPENRRYFSGFTGSSGFLLVTPLEVYLLTDFRYIEQASEQAKGFKVLDHKHPLLEFLQNLMDSLKIKRVGFEDDFMVFSQYNTFSEKIKNVEFVPVKDTLTKLRRVKDQAEIEFLTKAVEISDLAFTHTLNFIKPGVSEKAVSLELEYFMKKNGAEKIAFEIIVASGQRSALPHGVASEKIITAGDFVTMDFGAVYQGYHSDITRTVVVGHISEKQREIYNIVLRAQKAASNAIKSGKTAKEVDAVARDIITNAGFGDNFGHGLGHGVGLEIHEKPGLSPNDESILEVGMAVTVEPGIYIPKWGGVRIEDTVVVTKDGCKVLTNSTKELLII